MEVSFLGLRIGRGLRGDGVGGPNVKYLFRQNEITACFSFSYMCRLVDLGWAVSSCRRRRLTDSLAPPVSSSTSRPTKGYYSHGDD